MTALKSTLSKTPKQRKPFRRLPVRRTQTGRSRSSSRTRASSVRDELREIVAGPPRPSKNRGRTRRLLVQSRAKQNTLFLFRRIFWWRAQIRNRKEYFAWRRALANGGGVASIVQEFSLK